MQRNKLVDDFSGKGLPNSCTTVGNEHIVQMLIAVFFPCTARGQGMRRSPASIGLTASYSGTGAGCITCCCLLCKA